MPAQPNRLLRVAVPLIVAIAGVGVAWSVLKTAGRQTSSSPSPAVPAQTTQIPPSTPAAPTAGEIPSAVPPASLPAVDSPDSAAKPEPAKVDQPKPDQPKSDPVPPAQPLGLQAVRVAPGVLTPIGSTNPASSDSLKVEFSDLGAGISSMELTHHFETNTAATPVLVQQIMSSPDNTASLVPFAAIAAQVDGEWVALTRYADAPVWRETAPGAFEATIADAAGTPILRIERIYTLRDNSYGLTLSQRVTNLSTTARNVKLVQYGPTELVDESAGYGGDKRKLDFGYVLKPALDPSQRLVQGDLYRTPHTDILSKPVNGAYEEVRPLWPNAKSIEREDSLAWAAFKNRYFAVAVHRDVNAADTTSSLAWSAMPTVDRVVLNGVIGPSHNTPPMAMRLSSDVVAIAPGATADLSMGVYAGPLSKQVIRQDPVASAVSLDRAVYYNFGGLCGPCTFEFVTNGLSWLLRMLHDYIVFDWALAIVLLVVIVRGVMHPLTRWSQIRMQRFGKQMQLMQPKQKVIQERYKDDKKKQQEEMARLWREEGINPAGMLGCIPMFLQTPVWIALYATLYFTFELRHTPAFFGVFQKITNGRWGFLADLAEPDRAIAFTRTFNVPLLSGLVGPITSFNILPLILGAVFFVHQKYLTPPSAVELSPEQQTQQKMVKWMSVIMFPLFMYNAPSGLAIYFTVNSTLAIFENKWIRAHMDKHGLLDPDKLKPKPGQKGFLARLQAAAESRAKSIEQKKNQKLSNTPRSKRR